MQPIAMDLVLDGRLYTTKQALLLAHDAGRDGVTWERAGRNTFLFRDPSGVYFAEQRTAWSLESDYVEPLSAGQARQLYDQLPLHEVDPGLAFSEQLRVAASVRA
jgi:hypothetical protein